MLSIPNKYFDKLEELNKLYDKRNKINYEFNLLINDLKRRIEGLSESKENMLSDVRLDINNILDLCNHTDTDGNLIIDKHNSRHVIVKGQKKRILVCSCLLCGKEILTKL